MNLAQSLELDKRMSLVPFPSVILSGLDDAELSFDEGRVREKDTVENNPPTPRASDGHQLNRWNRLSRAMTVSNVEMNLPEDDEDGRFLFDISASFW